MQARTRRWLVVGVAILTFAIPVGVGAVGGFGSPIFGMSTTRDGTLLVAEVGVGIHSIQNDAITSTVALPGVTDVEPIRRNAWWATTTGEDPEADSGQGIYRVHNGRARLVANLFDVESSDPDGSGVDSNPFDVAAVSMQHAFVADAGGNTLLRVSSRGQVDVVATFPDEVVSTANLQALVDCAGTPIPDFAFICGIPAMPAQAVPTSIAIGPDGSLYVGELKGFPAPTGESNIWRIAPGRTNVQCGSSPHCTKVFDGGFTSIIDMAFGPDGTLYVAELDESSWFAVEFGAPTGGTINACDVGAGTCSEVATGIPIVTAITVKRDGTLWSTQNALIPGLAEVIQIP